ncbi:MAG: hypothetical protein ACR2IK_18455 [Chloroflexota bacterium]
MKTTVTWLRRRVPIGAAVSRVGMLLTPVTVAILVTAAYSLLVLWRWRIIGRDPGFFVLAGPPLADPNQTLPNLHVFPPGTTYDGQFFYRLALEPWTNVRTAYGITLDVPPYRQQRILYPLLAWVLSGGMWQLTPLALIVANLVAVALLAYSAAVFATTSGRSALASLLVPFYSGYVVTISRDLAELTEAALLAAGLVLLERRRFWPASAALTIGAFAKETLLGVPIAGIIVWAVRRARTPRDAPGPPLRVWLIPLVVYAAWSLVMLSRWGTTGIGQGSVNFGVPLVAVLQHLRALATPDWRADRVEIGILASLVGLVAAVAVAYKTRLISNVLPLACLLYAILALFYASYIWQDDYAYLRALHELSLTGGLAVLAVSVWAARALGLTGVVLWVAFVLQSGPAP